MPPRSLSIWRKTRIAFSVIFHAGTPLSAKALLGISLVYGIVPLDIIPDFLPILGGLDDAAVIIAAIMFFLRATKMLREDLERNADVIDVKPR